MIVAALAEISVSAFAWYHTAAAFAINFAVSNIMSRAFAPDMSADQAVDNGVRQQVPPSSTNSIPVVYGDAYLGGAFVDAALSTDAKTMYYVLVISHISPNGQFSFDLNDMYWGDRKITFDSTDQTKVVSLTDGAGNVDSKVSGNIYIALYTSTQDGVITSANGATLPSAFMGGADLPAELRWAPTNRQMPGLAFAIVKMNYNREAETTNMQSLTYHVHHYLNGAGCAKPGDVWYDYMTNEKYGAAMPFDLVDTTSVAALNSYSDEPIAYQENGTGPYYQPRYRINGVVDTGQSCLNNINSIMIVCDSWNQYNAAKGQWSIVINKATTSAYAFDDSTIIGEIRVSAYDITSSVNQIEAEFPSAQNRDQSDFVYYETPAELLYPNEPVNKQSVQFSMTNDSVQAQYLATRILEQAREDLIVSFSTAYPGIQVDAGDVVTVTNSSYGWSNKPFRVMRVSEASLPDGSLGASFELNEYNAQVYDDKDITKYVPAPNTDLPDPSYFGTVPAPTVASSYPSAAVPSFNVQPYVGTASFVTYAEVWYSAFPSPTASQLLLGGTTALPSNGTPYTVGQTLPTVNLAIPAGDWYLFTRLVNPIANSQYSAASAVFKWRPTTFQYTERWIAVAYADSADGTVGFSLNPRNKTYYGLLNNATANGSPNPADYTWYAGSFGTSNYLLIANRQNRKFSFAIGNAGFSNLGGAFVPTETSVYDTSLWGALEDGQNYIDLDKRTGQLTKAGTTAVSSADGLLSVSNNTQGSMVVSLQKFLNFGAGVYSKTFSTATLTVDVFGRVVGFTQPDNFYYTETVFSATSGQTTFAVNHVVGNILVFRDGILADTSEYTETTTNFTFSNACASGEIVVVINMRAVSTDQYYENINGLIASSTSNSITYVDPLYQNVVAGDLLCFAAAQPQPTDSPTTYTVQSVNVSTKTITFTTSISGAVNGYGVFRKRAAGSTYTPFSRYTVDVSSANTVTPSNFTIRNGFEMIYVNGVQLNEIDYDLSGNTLGGFPGTVTGKMTFIMFTENNFGVPASNVVNTVSYSINGALSYVYPNNPLAMEVYANGALLAKGSGYDYTANSGGYNLTQAFNNNFTLLNQQTFARIGNA
jgi:hypothetical protein